MAKKISPPNPDDPIAMMRWYQELRDELANPSAVIEQAKRTRGRNERDGNYTLVSTDAGKSVVLVGSAAKTFTIDASNFRANQQGIIRQEGSGQITLTAASGTDLRFHTDFQSKTKGQWSWIGWERISPTEVALTGHMAAA